MKKYSNSLKLKSTDFPSIMSGQSEPMQVIDISSDRKSRTLDIIESASGVLIDWDGCVALGDTILPAAARFLKENIHNSVIVSNNSTHLPEDIAHRLAKAGVSFPMDRIVLAGVETLHHATRLRLKRVMICGNSRMNAYAAALGLHPTRTRPEAVILMRHTRFTFAALQQAVNAVEDGARLIVSNSDRVHPGRDGRSVPETGALLAAIMACVPGVEPEIIGKPHPTMFMRACGILRIEPEQAVMIGDNPETDIQGARALGIESILLKDHEWSFAEGL